jgi:mRNA interferase MazF
MTDFDFGDIVLVPFPFSNQRASKQRPAAVISSASYYRARSDVLIMAITSQARPSARGAEAAIHLWKEAGLLKPSVFKPLIATVEGTLIRRRLGRLQPEHLQSLREQLREILGV